MCACACVCVCALNYWLLHLRMYYMHIIRGIPEWHCWLILPVMKAPASCIDSLLAVTPTHCMVTVHSEWRYKTGTPWWLHLPPLRLVRSTLVHMHTFSFNPRNTQITLTERWSKRQSKRIFTRIATLQITGRLLHRYEDVCVDHRWYSSHWYEYGVVTESLDSYEDEVTYEEATPPWPLSSPILYTYIRMSSANKRYKI